MSTGRANRTCLLNSGLPEKEVWCESTAFRVFADGHHADGHHAGGPSCARSSKRAGGLIPRIALDQCRVPERYRTRVPFRTRPHCSNTERAHPRRQVAGESPAGDTNSCGCGSTAECGLARAETTVQLRSPAPIFYLRFWIHDLRVTKKSKAASEIRTHVNRKSQILRSLWCSPDHMPASHAGDHRSEAGQGRQFNRLQSIFSDAFAR
jgi:hypothetical protein